MKILINFLFISILFSILTGCVLSRVDALVSPGRVNHYELKEKVGELNDFWESLPIPEKYSQEKLEIIGHGVGSYRHYPMRVNENDFPQGNKSKAKNITHLMDAAFSSKYIDAIELDTLLPSPSHDLCNGKHNPQKNCSFVMHDEPDWELINKDNKLKSFTYMQNNSVDTALNHFVERGYHTKGKLMYLELKCNSSEKKCTDDAVRVAEDIKKFIGNNKLAKNKRNWLTMISFSPKALKAFRCELENTQLHNNVDYALIAGYDEAGFLGHKKFIAQFKGKVPEFDEKMKDFIITTTWLNRVWFSTSGIDHPGSVFAGIDTKRDVYCEGKNCNILKYSVSSYDKKWEKFKKTLKDDDPFISNLVSIMIDVDD